MRWFTVYRTKDLKPIVSVWACGKLDAVRFAVEVCGYRGFDAVGI